MENYLLVKICISGFLLVYTCTISQIYQDPKDEFFSHTLVKPVILPVTTSSSRIGFVQTHTEKKLKLEFSAFEKEFVVHLKINKDLFSPKYKETYEEDGEEMLYHPINERERACYYRGYVPNIKSSWAAISTCDRISGIIYDGRETYYVEPDQLSLTGEHMLFKASDIKHPYLKCGTKTSTTSLVPKLLSLEVQMRSHEAQHENFKIDSKNCYIELIIVNDNSMYDKYNRNLTSLNHRAKQLANAVSGLYSSLNMVIALTKIVTWTKQDEIDFDEFYVNTLKRFLNYRKNVLLPKERHDNALFLTNKNFLFGLLGYAAISGMCTEDRSGELAVDQSASIGVMATAIAHEIGHTLGMDHDVDTCICPDKYCIMYPQQKSPPATKWSSCSKNDLNAFLRTTQANCLLNKPGEPLT